MVQSRTFGPGGLTMPAMWPPDVITKRIGPLNSCVVRYDTCHGTMWSSIAGDDVGVGPDLRDHQPLAQRDVLVVRERVLEVRLAQELGVGLARQVGAVGVPRQQVERRRLLAQQPAVDDVAEHEVVGAQQVEGAGDVLARRGSRGFSMRRLSASSVPGSANTVGQRRPAPS